MYTPGPLHRQVHTWALCDTAEFKRNTFVSLFIIRMSIIDLCGVHNISSGQLWQGRQVSMARTLKETCGVCSLEVWWRRIRNEIIIIVTAVEEIKKKLLTVITCHCIFSLQHYTILILYLEENPVWYFFFLLCSAYPCFFSCWLSLKNGAIWAFVAPSLFVIVVRNLQKLACVIFHS